MTSLFSSLLEAVRPPPEPDLGEPTLEWPVSQACTQAQFDDPLYEYWCREIGEAPRFHRKQWEFCYILQTLDTYDLMRPGRRALGFGVGQEPLPAVFAARGVSVLATDLEPQRAGEQGWIDTDQHASHGAALNDRGRCEPAEFERLVDFRYMDMSAIDADLAGQFDFCWSACAFEHLGSIAKGLEFVERSIDCLKPGGIAVHTTEFNCSSDRETLDKASTVLFRKRDFRGLARRLRRRGYELQLNFNLGDLPLDHYVDVAPYRADMHLKSQLDQWTTTSFGIVAVPIGRKRPTRLPEIATPPTLRRPVSQACTEAQLKDPIHADWCARIGEAPRLHRKQWEFSYILQALDRCGMIRAGRTGLGIEVGNEPLAAALAAAGVALVATQAGGDPADKSALNDRGLCDPAAFERLVDYRPADIAAMASELTGRFDFCWSSQRAQQFGSLALGLQFLEQSLDYLKPGGVAVHTTEFNCSSDAATMDRATTVLFRRRDFRALAWRLRERGYGLTLNFNLGDDPVDHYVDLPPYRPDRHLKLQIADWVSTSFGILAVPLAMQYFD